MRWIISLSSLVVGLCVGIAIGVSVAPRGIVVRDSAASPEMSVARFLACNEAAADEFSEAELGVFWVRWRLGHAWPRGTDWPTP